MRRSIAIPSAASLLLVGLFAAGAARAESVPETLQRQTQEMVDALVPGTASVWAKYVDPDARFVDESGEVRNGKQMIAEIRPLPEGISGAIAVTEFQVADHGDVAVTTFVDDEHESYHGHKLHCQYRTMETWRKTKDGWRLIASQVLALRTDPPSLPLSASLLDAYCGRYALTPAIAYEIRRKGDGLEGQQTGRKAEELRAEAPDVLFVPGSPRYRYLLTRDASGKITGLVQRREAWDLVWERKPS